MKSTILATILGIFPLVAAADIPVIVSVNAQEVNGAWQFDVALRHADTGWEHYADGWGIYTTEGVELGYRVLAHPHVNEQPFTRSLRGVVIAPDIADIVIRPHDLVHGDGPDFTLTLPR